MQFAIVALGLGSRHRPWPLDSGSKPCGYYVTKTPRGYESIVPPDDARRATRLASLGESPGESHESVKARLLAFLHTFEIQQKKSNCSFLRSKFNVL